jgi:hypothetical protein
MLGAMLTVAGAAGQSHAQGARVEVPIHQTLTPAGVERYSVPVKIGNVEVEAAFETGSSGLRVFDGAVDPANYTATAKPSAYTYTVGLRLSGVQATAPISIGGLTSAEPLGLQIIKDVSCVGERPLCQAVLAFRNSPAVRRGVPAVLGANMAPSDADNPLAKIGARKWIVILPLPGETQPGKLILNPTAEDMAGYTVFAPNPFMKNLKTNFHDSIFGCVINVKSKQNLCGPTLLDTSSPGVFVTLAPRQSDKPWPAGTEAAMAFRNDAKATLAAGFTTEASPASKVTFISGAGLPQNFINAGVLPYYAYAVLYDADAGTVALKSRAKL